MIYALDTNTVSYFIQDNLTVISRLRAELVAGNKIVISSVVYYEVRRGFKHKASPKKERAFSRMCTLYPIVEMNIDAWEYAADIYGERRKTGKSVEDTDILIAALCISKGYTLVTNNSKHFVGTKELNLMDWMQP